MNTPTVGPISLSGGIMLSSTQYDQSYHMDVAHIRTLNNRAGVKPTNLGIIEHFISSGYLKNMGSIFDFTGLKPRIIDVEGGTYTWETPVSVDDFYIVEDLSCTDKPGIDEQPFKIRLNRRIAGNRATLKVSKYTKFDLFITDAEILQDGDTWVYTVTIKGQNAKNGWFPKELLRAGTKIMQSSSFEGDTSTVRNDGGVFGTTRMEKYFNFVGEQSAGFTYTVGGGASGRKLPKEATIAMKDYANVIEMRFFKPTSEAFHAQLYGKDPVQSIYKGDKKAADRDVLMSAWVPAAEVAAHARVELDCMNEAIWGTGGTVGMDGQVLNTPIGLYHQLNQGNQHYYSIEDLTVKKLDGIFSSFFSGRMKPYQDQVIEITTGDGGMSLIKNMLQNLQSSLGMTMDSERFLEGKTNDMHFKTPSITSFDFAFGTLKFKVNPALNPAEDPEVENPYIGNYRLSSYMFILTDITGGMDNVVMLRNTDGWDAQWQFENGKANYMGSQLGYHGRLDVPWDFKVGIRKRHYAYKLLDPTKAFILKPYNPRTGKPFGEI